MVAQAKIATAGAAYLKQASAKTLTSGRTLLGKQSLVGNFLETRGSKDATSQRMENAVDRGLDAISAMFGVKDDKKKPEGVKPAKDPKAEASKDARTSGPTGKPMMP